MSRKIPKPDVIQTIPGLEDSEVFVDIERQSKGGYTSDNKTTMLINYAHGGVKIEDRFNLNPNLHVMFPRNYALKGPVGEDDPFYTSDFTSDTDGWVSFNDIVDRVDGIDGEDNVLRCYAGATEDLRHEVHKVILARDYGQIYRVTGHVYIPSTNTHFNQVTISDGYSQDGIVHISATDAWVNFEVVITADRNSNLYIYAGDGGETFVGTGSDTDDLFYIKNISIQRLGLKGLWFFGDKFHGEKVLLYKSNFIDSEYWKGYYANVSSNLYNIHGKDRVMKVWASGDTSSGGSKYHGLYVAPVKLDFPILENTTYNVKAKVYVPSEMSHLNRVGIGINSWQVGDAFSVTHNQWETIDITIRATSNNLLRFVMYDPNGSPYWASNANENDDYFYITDVEVYYVPDDKISINQEISHGGFKYTTNFENDGSTLLSNFDRKSFAERGIYNDPERGNVHHVFGTNNTGSTQRPAIWQDINELSPLNGTQLGLSYYYKYSANLSPIIQILKFDSAGNYVSTSNVTNMTADNKWHRYYNVFDISDIPGGKVNIYFRADYDNGETGEYFIDDIWYGGIEDGTSLQSSGFDLTNQFEGPNPFLKHGHGVVLDGINDGFKSRNNIEPNQYPREFSIAIALNVDNDQSFSYPVLFSFGDTHITYGVRYAPASQKVYLEWGKSPYDSSGYETCRLYIEPSTPMIAVFTYDGTNVKGYLNGELVETVTPSSPLMNTLDNLFIGMWGAYSYFKGILYFAAYYNKALTEREIKNMVHAPGYVLRDNTYAAYWFALGKNLSDTAYKIVNITAPSSQRAIQIHPHALREYTNAIIGKLTYSSDSTAYLMDGWASDKIKLDAAESPVTQNFLYKNTNSSSDKILVSPVSLTQGDSLSIHKMDLKLISDFNYHGVLLGGVHQVGFSSDGEYITLDGVNDWIRFGSIAALGSMPFIIVGWFKTDATNGTILSRRHSTNNWYRINITSGGRLQAELSYDYNDTTGNRHYETMVSDGPINDNVWHSYAVIRDNDYNMHIYIDKAKQSREENFPETLDSWDVNDVKFIIGAWKDYDAFDKYSGSIGATIVKAFPGGIPGNDYEIIVNNFHDQTQHKYLGG